ncbi:hypothetical protein ACOMHN_053760 [Nucella lapillus]
MASPVTAVVTYQQWSDVTTDLNAVTPESLEVPFKPWENPENLMDFATLQTVETIINVACVPFVVLVGVIGNVTNMIVFAKQGLRDRINVCLFSLALADCGYLVALFIYKSFSLLSLFSTSLGDFWKVQSLNTILGVFWGFSTVSVLLTLLVSAERCLCVVSPLRAKQLLKTKVLVIIIVFIFFLILSSSLIFNAKFTVTTKEDEATNTTVYIAVLSDFYLRNKIVVDVIFYNILIITIPCCSFIVVVICTSATVFFLKRAASWKQMSANVSDAVDKKETAVTKMLLLVCYGFVFFMTPTVLNAFFVQFIPGWDPLGRYFNTFYVCKPFSLLTLISKVLGQFWKMLRADLTSVRVMGPSLSSPQGSGQPDIMDTPPSDNDII